MGRGGGMENPILARLRDHLGVTPPDGAWLLTLLTVWEVGRYSLEEWNEALSAVMGRRVFCPSYRALARYLQNLVLEVK